MQFLHNVVPGRITIINWTTEGFVGFCVVFAPNENNEIVSDKVIVKVNQKFQGWAVDGVHCADCGIRDVVPRSLLKESGGFLSLQDIKEVQKVFEPSFRGEKYIFLAEYVAPPKPVKLWQCEMKPLTMEAGMYLSGRYVEKFVPTTELRVPLPK